MAHPNDFLLPNEPTCIAACTSAEARFWRSTTRYGDWSLLATVRNDEATASGRDLTTDRPGRAFDSFGSGRHAMAPREAAQDTETRRFARKVADWLDSAVAGPDVRHVVLVSEPSFLGVLRSELSARTAKAVVHELPKNPAHFDERQIRDYFS